jgi:hypothetical protein
MDASSQTSSEMQAAIVRWLHGIVVVQSVDALLPHVPGCERFLRSHGVDEIPPSVRPGVIGIAKIDNLLIQWFKEHRPKELRQDDAEGEHQIRDLTRVRPPKGTRPKRRRS